ncbi:MAG: imidazoleglycerol-phosphate dehydratase HisB [Acidimicrobiales bacterium]|jgi:imidazoleglycerol-phosphate dehydratase
MSSSPGEVAPRVRAATRSRTTKETSIDVSIDLSRAAPPSVATGLPFFDHMLEQLGKHGGFALEVKATGDLHVDAHHTVEDVGILLGETFAGAIGDKGGIRRFSSLALPLDEALVSVALDISGRAFLHYDVEFGPEVAALGSPPFEPQLAEEFWRAFVHSAGITLHISLEYGRNPHHVLEASFKGVARAIRDAVRVEGTEVPSTKGVL